VGEVSSMHSIWIEPQQKKKNAIRRAPIYLFDECSK
jgi:hypothetical protein